MFCTNGVLLRRLTSPGADKMLESLSHIVIDELHERDLFADFLTIVLRGVLARHPHLRLVLMSATVREDLFSEYFGGCPVIRVPGYTHPVADYHLEDILSLVGYGGGGGGGVHDFVHTATADPDGPEGQATQAAVMRAFLEGTDESFDSLLDTVRGVGSTSGVEERALVGVAHAGTGATALMAAAGKGRHMEVSQLIGMGADPTQRSRDGSSSADWARRFGHEDIAQTLDAAEEQIKRLSAMENASAQMSQYQIQADPDEVDIQLAQELIHWILTHRAGEMQTRDGGPAGAVLVFLPGWNEISQLRDNMAADPRFSDGTTLVLPLHSMVPPADQKRVFQRPPRGVRKVVLATNIAETAVTIDDVVFVVDSGRLKEKSYDAHTGVSTLQAAWISRASAQQRRGRAGRVRPGECYRLYSTARMSSFADFQLPEMQRSPLEELCLQVRMLAEASSLGGERGGGAAAVGMGQGSTAEFLLQAVEPPIPQAISQAVALLQDIGAMKEDEGLTRLGRHLGEMPVHPRVGKMLLYATLLGVLDPVLTVACAAAYRSPFVVSMEGGREAGKRARHGFSDEAGGGSDHLAVARAFVGWEQARARGGSGSERTFNGRYSLSGATLNMLRGMRQQLVTALSGRGLVRNLPAASSNAGAGSLVRAVLAVGMYPLIGRLLVPGVGQQAGGGMKATLATLRGEKVKIHPHSVNCKLHDAVPRTGPRGVGKPAPVLVCFDDITRGESQMYVKESTVVSATSLVLVASSLTVEQLPPVELPGTIRTIRKKPPRLSANGTCCSANRTRRARLFSWRTTGSSSAYPSRCCRSWRACASGSRGRSRPRCRDRRRRSRLTWRRRWPRRRRFSRRTGAPRRALGPALTPGRVRTRAVGSRVAARVTGTVRAAAAWCSRLSRLVSGAERRRVLCRRRLRGSSAGVAGAATPWVTSKAGVAGEDEEEVGVDGEDAGGSFPGPETCERPSGRDASVDFFRRLINFCHCAVDPAVAICHPCLLRNDFLAAIIAAVGIGSKNTGTHSCGAA